MFDSFGIRFLLLLSSSFDVHIAAYFISCHLYFPMDDCTIIGLYQQGHDGITQRKYTSRCGILRLLNYQIRMSFEYIISRSIYTLRFSLV